MSFSENESRQEVRERAPRRRESDEEREMAAGRRGEREVATGGERFLFFRVFYRVFYFLMKESTPIDPLIRASTVPTPTCSRPGSAKP